MDKLQVAIAALVLGLIWLYFQYKQNKLETVKQKKVYICYGTQSGTCKRLALDLQKQIDGAELFHLKKFDPEQFMTASQNTIIVILPTYYDATPPRDSEWFYKWLIDESLDFRASKTMLSNVDYAVFGVGHSAYGTNYNKVAKNVDLAMQKLGACRISVIGMGDSSVDVDADFKKWSTSLVSVIGSQVHEVVPGYVSDDDQEDQDESEPDEQVDLEDMGSVAQKLKDAKSNKVPEMVTPALHKTLTKQGYKIVGTHSGVKICRWTKAQMRNRGGCYKHTFYGIQSHQCMETTPSLACSNKCSFCWRVGSNPVSTTWKWKVDAPEDILQGALDGHYQMIKQMKGVPGVVPERYKEAFNVRHCALSLVGEPISYPRINEFVGMLHERRISSFLVCNAQHPEALENLVPITQLYVSVDAGTKDQLKAIDRPLFSDFWERFQTCLALMREKKQRTVYRLTLVKEYNNSELESYAELIRIGQPDFIEVKGVTFCFSGGEGPLRMSNVPFQSEVVQFVKDLMAAIGPDSNYEIACEHDHSCSILVADKKFKTDGQWNTWIDYDKFHELVASGVEFESTEYMAPTPQWAVYGNAHKGFDPNEVRFYRNGSKPRPDQEVER